MYKVVNDWKRYIDNKFITIKFKFYYIIIIVCNKIIIKDINHVQPCTWLKNTHW
jgi:hypothetical protein